MASIAADRNRPQKHVQRVRIILLSADRLPVAEVEAVRARGDAIPDALLAHVAPSGWQHINLTGDYLWGADGSLGPDGFRPLRNLAVPLSSERAA